MDLPKEIVTRNKIRDAKICRLWLENELTNKKIAERFGVSERLVGVIVYKNRACLKLDQEYEKQKRIKWLKRQIKKRGNSNKDSADLLEQLRCELQGSKGNDSNNNGSQKVVVIINENKDEDTSNEREISRTVSIVKE
jgi:hypothetical protein